MGVGMAMAERHLTYNQSLYNIGDHFTYAIYGAGDLMVGILYESATLAGHLS
jgi:transketolase